jgi:hypothetical protein
MGFYIVETQLIPISWFVLISFFAPCQNQQSILLHNCTCSWQIPKLMHLIVALHWKQSFIPSCTEFYTVQELMKDVAQYYKL